MGRSPPLVYFGADARRIARVLPPPPRFGPFRLEEHGPGDERVREAWPGVFAASFGRRAGEEAWRATLLEHPQYEVRRTALLLDGTAAIGTMSTAVARRNPSVGITHALGILPSHRGQGLGRKLLLWALHDLQRRGVERCEGESRLRHRESILMHYDLGFRPKLRLDPWNTPDPSPWPAKAAARARQVAGYAAWRARARGRGGQDGRGGRDA